MLGKTEEEFVTTSKEHIDNLRKAVYNKELLIDIYTEYFGEKNRERISEKIGKTYDFVIPIDIQGFNIQRYFLKDKNYRDAAYSNVATVAKEMLYSSSKQNLLMLNNFKKMLCVSQALMAFSEGEDEPFTLKNVFDYDEMKFFLGRSPQSGKGERYDEFMAKLFGVATEGFEGFESFESLTKKLISKIARIDGVTFNPHLKITDIQNELAYMFDIHALKTSMDSGLDSLNKVFGTSFKNFKDFEGHPVYKKVCSAITDARIKFVKDYMGRSVSAEETNWHHWSLFSQDENLSRKSEKYPIGFNHDSFIALKGSTMGDMTYFKTRNGVLPVVRVGLDSRTAFSTANHECAHALQMVEKDGLYYTGFSRPIKGLYFFSAFNEFYNEYLTKKTTEIALSKFNPSIRGENGSAYDHGVSLLTEFFDAYEERLKESVIDNGFEFAVDLFGIDGFIQLGAHCENLRKTEPGVINSLISDLKVKDLGQVCQILRERPALYRGGSNVVAREENNKRGQKVALASTIRNIDNIISPLVASKSKEKDL